MAEGGLDMSNLGEPIQPIVGHDLLLGGVLNQTSDSISTHPAEEQSMEVQLQEAVRREGELCAELDKERQRLKLALQQSKNASLEKELIQLCEQEHAQQAEKEKAEQLDCIRRCRDEQIQEAETRREQEIADLTKKHEEELAQLQHEMEKEKQIAVTEERKQQIRNKPTSTAHTNAAAQYPRVANWCEEVNRAAVNTSRPGFRASFNEVQDALNRGATHVDQTSGVNILSNIGISDTMIHNVNHQLQPKPIGPIDNPGATIPTKSYIVENQPTGVLELAGMAGPTGADRNYANLPPPIAHTPPPAMRNQTLEGGMGALVAGNLQDDIRTDIAEGESLVSVSTNTKQKKAKKSGMLAKPTHNIKRPAIWPHVNLQLAYAAAPVVFSQLSFEQLMAGEIKTIQECQDKKEVDGRLRLLSKLAWHRTRNYPWGKLRDLYAAIVREIEKEDSTWDTDWRSIEESVIDPLDRV